MSRVVTLGNAMVDVVARVPRLPVRGGDVLAAAGRLEAGGGGLRTVVAARAAGAEAVLGGRIGTGPMADLVAAELAARGVAAPLPRVVGADTGFVLTAVEPDGERTFVTVPGAESADPMLDALRLRPGDQLHVHGYGLVDPARADAVARFLAGPAAGATVLADPGPFGAAPLDPLLTSLDWWSGNGAEARDATGEEDPSAAAAALAARTRRGAVVRLGAAGCVVALRDADPVRLAAPAVRAVDTNGAGDTHVGAFLAALAAGAAPVDAARAAGSAAASFVARDRSPGT